jgi:hypothetical protein
MIMAVVTLVVALAVPAGAVQQTDPFEYYKEYLGVLAKATSIEPLLPYYTKEMSDGLRKMPKDMQANYVKMNKRIVTDVKVTKQSVDAKKAYFELTAKTSDGQPATGSATLVKEGGAWKVDDFTWVGPPPKG